ncbi:MAG: hypothetical protein AB8B65_20010 [Kordia sp.]|uniref:leucine-rich repeat domain-containing protein n=1 Tax=Kordia sp. TaxID=1965332 RepID=UPI00385F7BE6
MKNALKSKMTHFFKTLLVGFVSLLLFSCGNLLSDEEVLERYQKAADAKNWKAAKELLDEYLKRKPDEIPTYFTRAVIATNIAPLDLESILADLNTYLDKKPEDSAAMMFRFQTYLHMGEFEKALVDIETIIQRNGKLPFLLSWKANCAFMAQKFDLAAKVYEQRTRMPGSYEDVRNNYYYMIFSKHLGSNKEGAIWDTAFLDNRGFEQDSILMKNLLENNIKFEDLANFKLPRFTMEELEKAIKNDCHEFNLFPNNDYRRAEIMNDIAKEPRIEDLEALLPQREKVFSLNLSYNGYKELPKILLKFKNLQIVNLSSNRFTDIEKTIEDLSQLPNLRVLLLNNCGITQLPKNIQLLDQLLILSMRRNSFEKLPESIGALRNLKLLDVSNNRKLTALPKSIQNLQCLQVLDISQIKLTHLPAEVARCSQLVILEANRSHIETLPENFGDLINLRNLSMYINELEKLPQSFGSLEGLQQLTLSSNRLEGLPKSFKNLDSLGRVALDGNRFKTFPKALESLKSVYSIIVYDTPIKSIPYSIAEKPTLERIIVNPRYISQKNIDSLKAINPKLYVIPQK